MLTRRFGAEAKIQKSKLELLLSFCLGGRRDTVGGTAVYSAYIQYVPGLCSPLVPRHHRPFLDSGGKFGRPSVRLADPHLM